MTSPSSSARTLANLHHPIDIHASARPQPSTVGSYSDHHRRLLSVSRAVAEGRPLEEILYQVYVALQAGCPFDSWLLYLPHPISTPFNGLEASLVGMGADNFRILPIPQEPGIVRSVLQSGDPRLIMIEKANTSPNHVDKQYEVMYPIYMENKPYSVASIIRRSGAGYSMEEYDLALLFLSQAGLGLEKTLLAHTRAHTSTIVKRLLPLSRTLNRPLGAADVTEVIGKGAMAISGADRVAVYSHGPEREVMHLWSQGLTETGISQLIHLPRGSENKIQITEDIQTLPKESSLRIFSEFEGIRAMALYPVGLREKGIANIDCFFNLPHPWSRADLELLEVYVRQAAIALDNIQLTDELEDATLQTVLTLARALDIRDTYTANHSRKLANWAEKTARKMNCSDEDLRRIHWAALLHDIGKIGIPDSILHKNGPLTSSEWVIMKQHPELGASIVSPLRPLRNVTPIIRSHQEWFDGTGYPDGLSGDEIPLTARILTVVDAFGAMTDDRIYRKALTQEQALDELKRNAGIQFDREIVNIFLDVIEAYPHAPVQ